MTMFSKMGPDGKLTEIREIKQSDLRKCPHFILVASHYRGDGTCKCDDPEEREMMIRDWDYTEEDFK